MRLSHIFASGGLALALSLGACASKPAAASTPTIADVMENSAIPLADEAAARRALAEQWRQGDNIIEAGDRQQRDAKRAIRKSEKDVRSAERELKKRQDRLETARKALSDAQRAQEEGRRKVEEGRRLKANAETDFQTKYPGADLN